MVARSIPRDPRVARLTADPEYATELGHIDRAALCFIPAPLPLEHELRTLLQRIRRFPGHASTVDVASDIDRQGCRWATNPECVRDVGRLICQRSIRAVPPAAR